MIRPATHTTTWYPRRMDDGGRLADAAYWLVHHDVTGAPQTSKRAADRFVAAAMMAELIGHGAIRVESTHVLACTPAPRLDRLGAAVRTQILAVPELDPGDVLDGLAGGIRRRVADRLVESQRADFRRTVLFRRVAVARCGDLGPAWVRAGSANHVRRELPLTAQERFLLGLLRHSSVTGNPLADASPESVARALQWRPPDQPYAVLLEVATAALRSTAVAR